MYISIHKQTSTETFSCNFCLWARTHTNTRTHTHTLPHLIHLYTMRDTKNHWRC